jgi:hypothetical protein
MSRREGIYEALLAIAFYGYSALCHRIAALRGRP